MTTMKQFHWFWGWDDEKEENWLREMAQKGWHFKSVGMPGTADFPDRADAYLRCQPEQAQQTDWNIRRNPHFCDVPVHAVLFLRHHPAGTENQSIEEESVRFRMFIAVLSWKDSMYR